MKQIYIIITTLILGACQAENPSKIENISHSQKLFEANCTNCHGKDGKMQVGGAKDLTISTLNQEEVQKAIEKGSPERGMPPYGKRLKPAEIDSLVAYVMQFRK